MQNIKELFSKKKTVIGMIHLLPSPGYDTHQDYKNTLEYALNDLHNLINGGIDAVLIENDNDQPHQITAGPEVISFMTLIVAEIVNASTVPVGVEVLLNDPKASLAVAKNTGCQFIRTDYFVDRMSREEYGGEMYINPAELIAYQKKLEAEDIALFTDIQVKYATLLEKGKSIKESCLQAIKEGSDGVIVTGAFTGIEPELDKVREAKGNSAGVPIIIGSGFSVDNAKQLLEYADGAIVGSSIKKTDFNSPVSQEKVKELMKLVNLI